MKQIDNRALDNLRNALWACCRLARGPDDVLLLAEPMTNDQLENAALASIVALIGPSRRRAEADIGMGLAVDTGHVPMREPNDET